MTILINFFYTVKRMSIGSWHH